MMMPLQAVQWSRMRVRAAAMNRGELRKLKRLLPILK